MSETDSAATPRARLTAAGLPDKRFGPRGRPYRKSGFYELKKAVRALGPRLVDMRTTVGQELAAWRAELVRDLGGPDALSTQQAALIDILLRQKLLLESVDGWLLAQPRLVNYRKNMLLPVVRERQQLADAMARYLNLLGLERKKAEFDVAAALAALHAPRPAGDSADSAD